MICKSDTDSGTICRTCVVDDTETSNHHCTSETENELNDESSTKSFRHECETENLTGTVKKRKRKKPIIIYFRDKNKVCWYSVIGAKRYKLKRNFKLGKLHWYKSPKKAISCTTRYRVLNGRLEFKPTGMKMKEKEYGKYISCLLYTSPSPRD